MKTLRVIGMITFSLITSRIMTNVAFMGRSQDMIDTAWLVVTLIIYLIIKEIADEN